MAQTRTGYRLIDDTEVDAESPITESLMFGMRDQWEGGLCDSSTSAPSSERVFVPQRLQTSETSTDKFLRPDGAGGCAWGDLSSEVDVKTYLAAASAASTLDMTIGATGMGVNGGRGWGFWCSYTTLGSGGLDHFWGNIYMYCPKGSNDIYHTWTNSYNALAGTRYGSFVSGVAAAAGQRFNTGFTFFQVGGSYNGWQMAYGIRRQDDNNMVLRIYTAAGGAGQTHNANVEVRI